MAKKEDQDALKAEAFLTGMLLPVLSIVTSPIRAFYLGVGHATVASWALMALVTGGLGYLWMDLVRDLNMPITLARVESSMSTLRESELRIAEKEATLNRRAGHLVWQLGTLNWDVIARQMSMTFIPLPTTTKLILSWQKRGGEGGGLESQPVVPALDGGAVVVTFPFLVEWAPQEQIILSFYQEAADGRRVRWISSGRMETVR